MRIRQISYLNFQGMSSRFSHYVLNTTVKMAYIIINKCINIVGRENFELEIKNFPTPSPAAF